MELVKKYTNLLYILALAGIACLCFGASLDNHLISDGWGHMASAQHYPWFDNFKLGRWMHASYSIYRPLADLDFRISNLLFGASSSGIYFLSILIHLGNTLLIFAFSQTLIKNLSICFFVAALFCVFRMPVEVVFWCGTEDSTMMIFYLIGFLAFSQYLRRPSIILYIISLLAYTLSAFTKEAGLTLIVTLFVYHFLIIYHGNLKTYLLLFIKKPFTHLRMYFLFIVVALINVGIHIYLKLNAFNTSSMTPALGLHIIKNYLYALEGYFVSLISLTKTTYYSMAQLGLDHHPVVLITIGICVLAALRGGNRNIKFLILWVFISYLPYAIIKEEFRMGRNLYLTSAPFFIFLGVFIHTCINKIKYLQRKLTKMIFGFVGIYIIVTQGYWTMVQEEIWDIRSRYTQHIIHQLNERLRERSPLDPIYFLNVPESQQVVFAEAMSTIDTSLIYKYQFVSSHGASFDADDPTSCIIEYQDDFFGSLDFQWMANKNNIREKVALIP